MTSNAAPSASEPRDLVLAAQAGDQEAFAGLVRLYSDPIFRFLTVRGLRPEDAQDTVQETFLRAYSALDRYDPRYAVSTWLYTIAYRLGLNHLDARKHHERVEEETLMSEVPSDPDEQDDVAATRERLPGPSLWEFAKSTLPERLYAALWLRYGENLDVAATAKILGISGLHARVLLHRARTRLRKALTAGNALRIGSLTAGLAMIAASISGNLS
jgi:RNA polymerase sigma-70 factor, ECF subfamily